MKKYKAYYWKCKTCGKYSENKNCFYCEDENGFLGDCEKIEFEMENNWEYLEIGNIVKWMDELYIVSGVKDLHVELISFKYSNNRAYPSINWPYDPNIRVNSIKLVADNMSDYIKKSIKKIFDF